MTQRTATGVPERVGARSLGDGRRLAWSEWGSVDGRPVLLFHGAPGSSRCCPDLAATVALGRLASTSDRSTLRRLRAEAEQGDDLESRHWACIALGRIGGREAEASLRRLVRESQSTVASFAAIGLAILDRESAGETDASECLRHGLRNAADPSARGAFCIALAIADDVGSTKDLVKILRESDANAEDLRGYAAFALGMLRARSTVPLLGNIATDPAQKPGLRQSVVAALGLMGSPEVVALTGDVIATRPEETRIAAVRALGMIGDADATSRLTALCVDPSISDLLRAQTVMALGKVAENEMRSILHTLAVDNNYWAMVETQRAALAVR